MISLKNQLEREFLKTGGIVLCSNKGRKTAYDQQMCDIIFVTDRTWEEESEKHIPKEWII